MSIDVRKNPIPAQEILQILAKVRYFWGKKGAKIITLDRKNDQPSNEEVLHLFRGNSGNMRAPVLVCGDKAMGGYDQEMYRFILGIGSSS